MALFNREPVAAGAFYPLDSKELTETISDLFIKKPYTIRKGLLNGMIVPHAGYIYSGKTAARAYYELSKKEPRTIIILGPNHTGMGDELSIMGNANYQTPLGTVVTDKVMADELCNSLKVKGDFLAHSKEHSIEVQLPFLQYLYGNKLRIVPVLIGNLELNELKKLGTAIAKLNATVIASSDFTHHGSVYGYNPFNDVKNEMYEHDMTAIQLIQELRINEFHELGSKSTICGYKPITALMQAMKERGAKPKFLNYNTSADVTKDYKNVVAYASIIFK